MVLDVGRISLNQCLAKQGGEDVVAILASCMVNALAFFNAILQDLMQDVAFSFAKMCPSELDASS